MPGRAPSKLHRQLSGHDSFKIHAAVPLRRPLWSRAWACPCGIASKPLHQRRGMAAERHGPMPPSQTVDHHRTVLRSHKSSVSPLQGAESLKAAAVLLPLLASSCGLRFAGPWQAGLSRHLRSCENCYRLRFYYSQATSNKQATMAAGCSISSASTDRGT